MARNFTGLSGKMAPSMPVKVSLLLHKMVYDCMFALNVTKPVCLERH